MIRPLAGLVIALAASAVQAEAPRAFRAEYAVYVDGRPAGESVMELQVVDDGRWRHTVAATGTKGLARLARFSTQQLAEFDFPDDQPRLLAATMEQRSLMSDRDVQVDFDWEARRVRWTGDLRDGEAAERTLEGRPATGSSLNLQLAWDARHGESGTTVHYVMHDRGRASEVDYAIGSAEAVSVPAGDYRAIPLRSERRDRQRLTVVWYDPALPPTPVRVLQTERGKAKYELRLVRLHASDAGTTR